MSDGWSFALINDTHVGAGYGDYGNRGHDDGWHGEDYYLTERLERTVQWLNAHREEHGIRFVGVLGDITQSAEESEYLKAREVLDRLEMPYVPLLGNHDVWPYTDDGQSRGPSGSERFDEVFAPVFERLAASGAIEDWKKDAGTIVDTPAMNFSFSILGLHFIALDLVSRNRPVAGRGVEGKGIFHPETRRWLMDRLAECSSRPVVLLSHHPLTGEIEPPEGVGEPQWLGVRAMIALSVPSREDCEEIARCLHGQNVPVSFAGHIHSVEFMLGHLPTPPFIWDFNRLEFRPIGNTESYVTEALVAGSNGPDGRDKGTIRLVRVSAGHNLDWRTVTGDLSGLNPSFDIDNIDSRHLFVPHRFSMKEARFRFDYGDGTTSGEFENFQLGWADRVNLLDAKYHEYRDGNPEHVVTLTVKQASTGGGREEQISRVARQSG